MSESVISKREIQQFTKGWAIVSPTGRKPWIIWTSVKLTRKEAIECALESYCPTYRPTWKQLYRQGFRAIKVRIDPR